MSSKIQNDVRYLREIRLVNLLSFGAQTSPLQFENLNVLIGPNGAGKSNLIEALALIRSTPIAEQTSSNSDVRGVLRRGGGAQEWIWKGAKQQSATIQLVVAHPKWRQNLSHVFTFGTDRNGFRLLDERVENELPHKGHTEPYFYYSFQGGHPVVKNNIDKDISRKLDQETVNLDASILSQRRDPELYPELTYIAENYEKWRIYREWAFGRCTVFREPQKADMRNDRLEEDFSNLGLFLSRLRKMPKVKQAILEGLSNLYEGLSDFETYVEGGTVQVFFTEGDYSIPATRLSDGTLRYLCLLAILCDPTPPPLICIEEPELGLHPDILPKLADLLLAASHRTQLIITTHSDILVDAMTDHPEVVIVCEKHDGCTQMSRLVKEDLKEWLEKYRLGELWSRGQLGGNRW